MKYLKEMKIDESKAPQDYRKLLAQVHNTHDRMKVLRIIKDEERHLKVLKTIK